MGYELRDYLEIDEAEALRQWRAICQREILPAGKRQEPFRPIEVVLCFALFRVVDPNSYGGGNRDRIPAPVQALARTLRRPAMSLLYKMQNLTAAMPHGAKLEPEVFLRLSTEPARFSGLYRCILDSARGLGLGESDVPDVVGIVGGVDLLGQDEIGSRELEVAQREYSTSEAGHYWNAQFAQSDTERLVESRVRIGQDRFARQVLADYEHKCAFCGFEPVGFESSGMLVASHIKPWAKCESNGERLDRRNGVAACPMHDRAFDSGLITVNGGQRIHRTRELRLLVDRDQVARYFFGSQVIHEQLLVPDGCPGPGKRYLDYHKQHVFRGVG